LQRSKKNKKNYNHKKIKRKTDFRALCSPLIFLQKKLKSEIGFGKWTKINVQNHFVEKSLGNLKNSHLPT
jgi:hypothetical protein